MSTEPDSKDQGEKTYEGYNGNARHESIHTDWTDWIDLYFDLAFRPFETTQKVAELLWKSHGQQQKDASEYWYKAEDQVWGPNRELIRVVAYFMWDMAGKQSEMALSSWVAAEKYVASLMALATKLSASLNDLMKVFSPTEYLHQVQYLAKVMSRRAGQQRDLDYWLAAERYVLTIMLGIGTTTQTLQDANDYLVKLTTDFSYVKYLNRIHEDAYYIWKRADQPSGKDLEHWIESEEAALTRIREGISSNFLDKYSSYD